MLEHTKLLACALISSLFMSQATYAQEVKANVEVKDTSGVMITDVRLQDDYYNAVNKDWLNSAVIKDGYSGTNAGMEVYYKLNEQKYELVNELIADKKNLDSNSDEKKIVNLYENYLNTEQRNKEGITPIMPILNKIKNIKSLDEINNLDKDNIVNPILSFQCMADLEDSDKYALYINSSTLSLGDSDVYVSPTDMSKKKQELYSKYFIKILTLAGYTEDQAKAKVDNKFKFEYMIATYIMGKEESTKDDDSIKKIYNVLTADELDSMAPNLKIKEYLKNAKVDNANKIILTEPKWFKGLNDIYKEENLQMLKDYIEISNLSAYVSLLSDDFAKAQTEFANELMGSQGETSKEEKAMALVASVLDESLGKAYVEKYFDPEVKTNVESMINDVITNYKSRINNLDWMSDETKSNAIKKLDSLKVNVAYPDKWEDYSALDIKSYDEGGSLVENIINVTEFEKEKELAKLNTTVDKGEMIISPLTVDACYSPLNNSINIPAGILQKPFYDKNASKESNYGAIGTIIGHEISHAFDNTGAQFDCDGNMKNWWTDEDYSKFKEKTQKVRDFYSNVKADNGKNINGDLTVGENIADISGVACNLDIVNQMSNPNYKDFFESYAKIWRMVCTPESLDASLESNVHSPHKIRVNAVLPQFEEFYKTYGITENDKMYVKPEDRLKIW